MIFSKEPKRALAGNGAAGAHRLIVAPVLDRENADCILEWTAKDYLP